MRNTSWHLAVVCFLAAGAAGAQSVTELVDALQSNPARRVEAVQLLPRYGAEPAPLLLPLLADTDPTVSKAADNVLWAIANRASRPGSAQEAAKVTDLLLERLRQGGAELTMRRRLRLLGVAAPEGHDLAPLADLLDDPTWREPARTTLERIATTEACAALREALDPDDAAFSAALLNSLAAVRDPESLVVASEYASHGDPGVRAAAAYALARSGRPVYAETMRRVLRDAPEEAAVETGEAFVLYAEAMVRKGGNWDLAIRLLKDVPSLTECVATRDAALAALCRHGDETVVKHVLAAALHAEPETQAIAIAALADVRGRGVDAELAAAYAGLPAALRPALVRVLGRRGSQAALAVLESAARSEDRELRLAALAAMRETGGAGALPVLVEAAGSGDPEQVALALPAIERIAAALRAAGPVAAAGRAASDLARRAGEAEARPARALDGILACPTPEAFAMLLDTGEPLDLSALPVSGRIAFAGALASVGRQADAEAQLAELLNRPLVGADLQALLSSVGAQAEPLGLPERLGFVRTWRVVGPFPFRGPGSGLDDVLVGEPNVDLAATYAVGDQQLAWQPVTTADPTGTVDLMGLYGALTEKVCYAYAEIEADADQDVALRMGSDDGIKAWLNGEVVWNNDVDRGSALDQDTAPAKLRAGRNTLLVKISQGGGGWNFRLRFTTPEGVGLPVRGAPLG